MVGSEAEGGLIIRLSFGKEHFWGRGLAWRQGAADPTTDVD